MMPLDMCLTDMRLCDTPTAVPFAVELENKNPTLNVDIMMNRMYSQ